MWGRLGPRFAVETAFLILLAVGLGLADQDWVVIVAVMAAGWALVSVIELVASQRSMTDWVARPAAVAEEEPSPVEASEAPVDASAPAPLGAVTPTSEPLPEPASTVQDERPAATEARRDAVEDTQEVEPPEPPKKRRWFRRQKHDENGTEIAEPPSHVRRIDPSPDSEPASAESAEGRS
jgi:hypothetical protein